MELRKRSGSLETTTQFLPISIVSQNHTFSTTETISSQITYHRTMNRASFALLVASMMIAANGFTPSPPSTTLRKVPYFGTIVGNDQATENAVTSTRPTVNIDENEAQVADKKNVVTKPKAAGSHSKNGPLAPFVILAKKLLGEEELNQLRGKIIAEHSKVIGGFVDTSRTEFGDVVLRMLFELADKDKSGTIEEEELAAALRTLGFDLKDNQIKGIFDRADKDENGAIDFEEWRKEAPSTLRTNLIKLAKRNGGELGFLA